MTERVAADNGRRGGRQDSEADRIALVDQLWKLKKHWQEHTGRHVPLNVLIKEVEYRRDVLNGAEQSGDPQLTDIVRRIRRIEERLGEIDSITQPQAPHSRWAWSMTALLAVAVVFAGILAAFGPSRDGYASRLPVADADIAFRLHGSNTIGEQLAPALLQAFFQRQGTHEMMLAGGDDPVERQLQFVMQAEPERVRAVEIHAHGSSTAFQDLAQGATDFGMSSRPIKPAEVDALRAAHGDLSAPGSEHVIALDGLAVIVNRANRIDALDKRTVAGIFSGSVRNWSELGGPDAPINLYARDDNSGTFDTFKSLVLKPDGAALAANAARFESSTELSDRVAADVNAIGFIGLPYVKNAKALAIAETAGMPAVLPTEFTVSSEDYPLSRRLFFYVPANTAQVELRDFIEFTLSEAGQVVVEETGLVSQRVRIEPVRPRAGAPSAFESLTQGADRLSVTVRFLEPGRLDNKSARDIERLVEFMKHHRDRRLLLLGFAAAGGDAASELEESRAQARMVDQMLAARGIFAAAVEGFGNALPIASNETDAGRRKNRRVEVWLR